jgi:hypothetical protein
MKPWLLLLGSILVVGALTYLVFRWLGKFPSLRLLVTFIPILVTVALILWTWIVYPHSRYGDDWAVIPAVITGGIVPSWHMFLLWTRRHGNPQSTFAIYLLYGLVHGAFFFYVWFLCLHYISKDSL